MSGKLFVFEGPDNVGKTTLAKEVFNNLQRAGYHFDRMSFPGKGEGTLGKLIYQIHHNSKEMGIESLDPTSNQLLHIAAHVNAIETQIKPKIAKGINILLDRYWWSTLVYGIVEQANEVTLNLAIEIDKNHFAKIKPETVFLIQRDVADDTPNRAQLVKEYERLVSSKVNDTKSLKVVNDDLEQTVDHLTKQILRSLNV